MAKEIHFLDGGLGQEIQNRASAEQARTRSDKSRLK